MSCTWGKCLALESRIHIQGVCKGSSVQLVHNKHNCNSGNTCVKGPCMLESLYTTLSYKSVFIWGTEWLNSLYVNWPIC